MVLPNLHGYVAMGVLATSMHELGGLRIVLDELTASAFFSCLHDFPVHSRPPNVAPNQSLHSYDSEVAFMELF